MIKMDMNELLHSDEFMELLFQKIVDEVVKRLRNQPKRALVIYTGAKIGCKEATDQLAKLKKDGWEFEAYFSKAAYKILNVDYIKKGLGLSTVYTEEKAVPKELLKGVNEIILATTTVNTAAKIANGICDTPLTTLISQQIMAGQKFVCAVDGACPDSKARAELGMGRIPKAYRDVMKNNLRTMSDFGFDMIAAADLYDKCTGTPAGAAPKDAPAEAECAVPAAAHAAGNAAACDLTMKHVIGRTDIIKAKAYGAARVAKDALVTAYAADTATELGIQIERI